MYEQPVAQHQLKHQLLDLGVDPGGTLLVHCAYSQVSPVEGGPSGLIEVLQEVVGPDGTLVMPSMTNDDEHPFDPATTPCLGMGIIAQTFWGLPGVLRSDCPHAFAARGPQAAQITAPHPVDIPHGIDSPVGRVFSLDGQVLLLGVGHDSNTTIHLAENLAGVRYRRRSYVQRMQDGKPVRYEYSEIDHCCQNFSLVESWLDAQSQQQVGVVGHATARLARSRDIVEAVLERLLVKETVFLHPPGVDAECDEAWASLWLL